MNPQASMRQREAAIARWTAAAPAVAPLHPVVPVHPAAPAARRAAVTGGAGLPQDRLAWLAAQQAFVELRQVFSAAVAACPTDDVQAEHLRERVRAAEDPLDLWRLHAPLADALEDAGDGALALRRRLLDALRERFDQGPGAASSRTAAPR